MVAHGIALKVLKMRGFEEDTDQRTTSHLTGRSACSRKEGGTREVYIENILGVTLRELLPQTLKPTTMSH